jgi:MscS family membrane protein
MSEFLTKAFYGNTFGQWLTSFAIIVAAVLIGKTLYWLFSNVLRRLTRKTSTKLDDIVLDMIEEPIVVAVTIFGIWYGLRRLTFPENVDEWIGHAMQGVIILSVTWLVARLLDSLIREYLVPLAEKSENDLDDQLLPIVRRSAKLTIWALGIIVALNNAGYEVGPLIAGLGIGGLALAMAARDTVSNVFGGFTIFSDRPFTINDRVRVAGFDGTIREIGLRSTRLQTLAGTVVTIPNSTFADSPVENVSAEPSRKVVLELGLTYDTPPEKMEEAMATLRSIAEANEDLEEDLVIGFNAFNDSAMNILFIYYIRKGSDIIATQTAMNLGILRQFNAKGLELAFPTQTILHQAIESGG